MLVNFTKMHSLGNNFVILDLIDQYLKIYPGLIKNIADYKFGVGCDQVLTLEAPIDPESDFFYRIFNQDGSEAEQCGNGARCLARFMHDQKHTNKNKLTADCKAGKVSLHLLKNRQVSVCFDNINKDLSDIEIKVKDNNYKFHMINVGNPHAVCLDENLDLNDYTQMRNIATELLKKNEFSSGANIEFVNVINEQEIKVRVYERGVGFTTSCGTGALSSMLVTNFLSHASNQVRVHFEHGYLKVHYQTDKNCALMAGPTNTVFNGKFKI